MEGIGIKKDRILSMKTLYKCKLSALEKISNEYPNCLCARTFLCAHTYIAHVRVRKCIFLSLSHSLFLYWTVVQWHITIYSAYLMYMVRGDSKVKKNEKKISLQIPTIFETVYCSGNDFKLNILILNACITTILKNVHQTIVGWYVGLLQGGRSMMLIIDCPPCTYFSIPDF